MGDTFVDHKVPSHFAQDGNLVKEDLCLCAIIGLVYGLKGVYEFAT